MLDKRAEVFPIKKSVLYLAHCGVSPLYPGAFRAQCDAARRHMDRGTPGLADYVRILDGLREAAARLLGTDPSNFAFVKNTTEALSMVAGGYPFEPGDEIVSYVHEYPANHYPWRVQERRGVKLVMLPDRNVSSVGSSLVAGRPCGWDVGDLEKLVTERTRIVAVSHVQFTSGFAAELKRLGAFCRSQNIDLVVDAAQSLGCLPLYPDEWNISAVASSGWKWLLGPVGTGLFYTAPQFREKLGHVMVGAETMVQGMDYLNHTWEPHSSARRFEYSTSPVSLAAGLEACITDLFLRYGPEAIAAEVFRLQDVFLDALDRERFTPLIFEQRNRSGILSLICPGDPDAMTRALGEEKIICSSRGGYLRIAPHFYNTQEEMRRAAEAVNGVGT